MSSRVRDRRDELGDAVVVVAEVGMALGEGAHQYVGALAPGGGASGLLLRVHGDVGPAHGPRRRTWTSPEIATIPKADEIAKPSPDSGERVAGGQFERGAVGVASAITQYSSPPGR